MWIGVVVTWRLESQRTPLTRQGRKEEERSEILVVGSGRDCRSSRRAHHPFTPYYDASTLASISGPIVELPTVNPHVVLIIDGTGPDGRTGRWAFEGLPPNAFQYRGLKDYKDRLKPGTTITISGWPATDPQARAFSGREVAFADGTTMLFGISTPGTGEDRWKCLSDPCPQYTYPDVQ